MQTHNFNAKSHLKPTFFKKYDFNFPTQTRDFLINDPPSQWRSWGVLGNIQPLLLNDIAVDVLKF